MFGPCVSSNSISSISDSLFEGFSYDPGSSYERDADIFYMQGKEVYIEDCKTTIKEITLPLDKGLNFCHDRITLLFKPGHYDILYKDGDRVKDINYDNGFIQWTKIVNTKITQVFENKEKEKQKTYDLKIADIIKTMCCNVSFSKDEYIKALILNNVSEESPSYNGKLRLKCICGVPLSKSELTTYFGTEVDNVLKQMPAHRSCDVENTFSSYVICVICKEAIDDNFIECSCKSNSVHIKCFKLHKGKVTCPTCNKIGRAHV